MISCAQYDYIEIACLFHIPVRLLLKEGCVVEGVAMDTKRNDLGAECIALSVGSVQQLVVLDQVERMIAMVENPHFEEVRFSSAIVPPVV